jgi:hypothetical protein
MAKLTPGALINGAAGAQGTIVFSHNRGGFYSRARVVPINKMSTLQLAWRANVKAVTQRWSSTLTDAQRLKWAGFAERLPRSNSLGTQYKLPGFNQYIASNVYQHMWRLTFIDNPPGTPHYPALTNFKVTQPLDHNHFTLTWSATTQDISTTILVLATKPLSAGRSSPNGTWAYVTIETLDHASPLQFGIATYTAHHPAPLAGQKTFWKATVWYADTGVIAPYWHTSNVWIA